METIVEKKIVIDASIGIKWFKSENENNLENALFLREKILNNEITVFIPDLFLYEVLNTLLLNTGFIEEELNEALNTIYLMELQIINSDKDLTKRALSISYNYKITYYDSLYISLAEAYNALLVTEDKKILSLREKFNFIKPIEEL
ncbi:type II toxin-antitoxin system VapC family toxin [bacterium]|nr:type II toxin-antitoxin system VapC family toxin [bacterium]